MLIQPFDLLPEFLITILCYLVSDLPLATLGVSFGFKLTAFIVFRPIATFALAAGHSQNGFYV